MASRSKQKEELRARRLAAEQAAAERTRQQRRLRMLLIIAASAVAAVAIAIVVSSNKSNSSDLQTGAAATKLKADVNHLLGGIPQSGATLGSSSAPVTMTYYGDLECPICQDFTLKGGLPQLVASDVRAGRVKVVYKNLETATHDPHTFQTQQVAALAAGKQNHFWDYAELFYRQQGAEGTNYVNDSYLTGIARQIAGLNLNTWRTDRSDSTLAGQITTDARDGQSAGVTGTPTLIMDGPKGKAQLPESVPSYAQLQAAIQAVS